MTVPADPHHLARFIEAQARDYATALAELRAGSKRSHWIWYVLPQLRGLGHSSMAQRYGITGLAEARAYLAHPLLGARLQECVEALDAQQRQGRDAVTVLGELDALKYRSCLTLFAAAAGPDSVFAAALRRGHGGVGDPRTLALLGGDVGLSPQYCQGRRMAQAWAMQLGLAGLAGCSSLPASERALCRELALFVDSAEEDTRRSVRLTTDWGGRFSGRDDRMFEQGCASEQEAGRRLCAYLLEHTSREYPYVNVQSVTQCFGTGYIGPGNANVSFDRMSGSFSTSHLAGVNGYVRIVIEFDSRPEHAPPFLQINAERNDLD